MIARSHPVIGMTLRFDRLDNFWFVLMHELAHVALHYESGTEDFYDDLESEDQDPREREADTLAGEVLIPSEAWARSPASRLRSPAAVQHLARSLRIHPAIVAGRIRREFKSYRVLADLVGQGEVRKRFSEVVWPE
jgi:HTH-type transcriptional regulator/antitoxin HigA